MDGSGRTGARVDAARAGLGTSGTGEGWKCGRMHIRVFLEECGSPDDRPKAHGSKSSGSPDARSLEASATVTIAVSGKPRVCVYESAEPLDFLREAPRLIR